MAKASRWMVKAEFGDHQLGDIVRSPKVAAEYPDHLLRLPDEVEPEAEAPPGPLAEARQAEAMQSLPLPATDEAKGRPPRTSHRITDKLGT